MAGMLAACDSVAVARVDDARLSGEVVLPAVIDVGDERVKVGVHTGEDEGEVGEFCPWWFCES